MNRKDYEERGCAYVAWFGLALVCLATMFIMFGCKATQTSNGFAILKSLTEAKLKQLLNQNGNVLSKDSIDLNVTVLRSHTVKVLGKDLSKFFTKQGEAVLKTEKLYLQLAWLPVDSAKVKLRFVKTKLYDRQR
jgi:hypothetical protein